ncbi:AbiTii domain-containing protein [Pectobacterium brasiliense]|uniref:AbiTii domain-containing protein n=1 Tax=Pectobacterium brasiliense TaxID=180957 RepID=UPI001969522E|nr:hypothetical protein [Pectobacterium brasiliense]MBN3265421.1 hypothetical protein [Pectobacterium brasiliense]
MNLSRTEHELSLVRELLDEIELSKTSIESLILKSSRLARLCGNSEFKKWLSFELKGYNSKDELSLKYMSKTGRWTDRENNKGYWIPISQIEILMITKKIEMEAMTTPNISGVSNGIIILREHNRLKSEKSNAIAILQGVISRTKGMLHDFISDIFYEKEFENMSETIFYSYKKEVDLLISENCRDVINQIPSVINRLSDGNSEAVSQALVTVRRIIESFADNIYPPTENKITIGQSELSLDASKHQNRINAFVHERIESKSRKNKIRQNLSNLYDRVSTGVHKEVSIEEAKSLFLNTYLFLGEILHIAKLDKIK